VEAGFQSGCNDYITKPINGFELVTLLQSYLGE
jgi:CheY-like chemotaxis protein